jgi:hypothetical protein
MRKKESSFFGKKEAKKLFPFASASPGKIRVQTDKSFLVLFFKKELAYDNVF